MIAQIDILYEISKFVDDKDSFVYGISIVYRLPHQVRVNMGIVTTYMTISKDSLEQHPSLILRAPKEMIGKAIHSLDDPSKMADFILSCRNIVPNFMSVIECLITTVKNDDALFALKFVEMVMKQSRLTMTNVEFVRINDDELMKGLCRYDAVLQAYVHYFWRPLKNIMSYSHGRSMIQMYRPLRLSLDYIKSLVEACTDLDVFTEFLDAVTLEKDGMDITSLIAWSPLMEPEGVMEKYFAKYP